MARKKLARKTDEISVRKSDRSKRLNSTKYGGKTSDSQLKREKVFLAEEGQVQKTDENHLVETEEFLNSKLSCRESKVMLKRTEVLKNNSKHPIFMTDPNKRGTNQILSKHEDLNIADISKLAVSKEVETNYAIRNAESKLDNKLVKDKENESNKSPKESDLEDGLIQRNFIHFLDRKQLDASMYALPQTGPELDDRPSPKKVASHKKGRRRRGKNRKVNKVMPEVGFNQ